LQLSFLGRDHILHAQTDYSAGAAKDPVPIRKARHVWPRLLLRTLSNWEQNGTQPEGEEKWRLYKTAGKAWPGFSLPTTSLHGGKNLHNLRIQLGKLQSQHALARM
jgi:hypothetical protein